MRPRGPTCGACYQRRVRDPSIGLQWIPVSPAALLRSYLGIRFTDDSSTIAGLPSVLDMPRWSRPTDSDPHRLCRNQIATIHPRESDNALPLLRRSAAEVYTGSAHSIDTLSGLKPGPQPFSRSDRAPMRRDSGNNCDSLTWWSSESAGAPATGRRRFRREVWAAWPEPSSCRPARASDSSK